MVFELYNEENEENEESKAIKVSACTHSHRIDISCGPCASQETEAAIVRRLSNNIHRRSESEQQRLRGCLALPDEYSYFQVEINNQIVRKFGLIMPLLEALENNLQSMKLPMITTQLLSILDALRSLKLLHRDIKVDNLMFDQASKRIKLIDFGCAVILEHDDQALEHFPTSDYIMGNRDTSPDFSNIDMQAIYSKADLLQILNGYPIIVVLFSIMAIKSHASCNKNIFWLLDLVNDSKTAGLNYFFSCFRSERTLAPPMAIINDLRKYHDLDVTLLNFLNEVDREEVITKALGGVPRYPFLRDIVTVLNARRHDGEPIKIGARIIRKGPTLFCGSQWQCRKNIKGNKSSATVPLLTPDV